MCKYKILATSYKFPNYTDWMQTMSTFSLIDKQYFGFSQDFMKNENMYFFINAWNYEGHAMVWPIISV